MPSSQPPSNTPDPSRRPSKFAKHPVSNVKRRFGTSPGYQTKIQAEAAQEAWSKCYATYNPSHSPAKWDPLRCEWYFHFERDE